MPISLPTLGFEDDTSLSKADIANTQLCEAIDLFRQGKFLAALTLAGAAEAVLAGLLSARGEPSTVERAADEALRAAQSLGLAALGDVRRNDMFNVWNAGRNSAKHHDKRDGDAVVMNVFDEAYWMIRRALANAKSVGVSIDNEVDFENWVVVNIN